jgi:hypothetical protein
MDQTSTGEPPVPEESCMTREHAMHIRLGGGGRQTGGAGDGRRDGQMVGQAKGASPRVAGLETATLLVNRRSTSTPRHRCAHSGPDNRNHGGAQPEDGFGLHQQPAPGARAAARRQGDRVRASVARRGRKGADDGVCHQSGARPDTEARCKCGQGTCVW